ncbi:Uncharacterised protein [Mycobacteroides abscessus subsp. abscessus]|nr:Uncharacterised protein [Mycobacteroides abscessus subsp. abscessus]
MVLISTGGQCLSRISPARSATRGCPRSIATSPMNLSSLLAAKSHANSPPARSPTNNATLTPMSSSTPVMALACRCGS